MLPSTNVQSLVGATLYGRDRHKIGKVSGILVDAGDGHPTWASVKVGLLAPHPSFVPLDDAVWDDDDLFVDLDAADVKSSPTFDGAEGLSPEQEIELRRHYAGGEEREPRHVR